MIAMNADLVANIQIQKAGAMVGVCAEIHARF
jgi:hypothetical protein